MGWFFAPIKEDKPYKPEPEKVQFCGGCNRVQHGGNCCMSCGRFTVYWNQGAESISEATRKWKKANNVK